MKEFIIFLVNIVFMYSLFISKVVNQELFTSTAQMEILLETEKQIPGLINKYIESEHKRLDLIKKMIQGILPSTSSLQDPQLFLSNPINIFNLIKKFRDEISPVLLLMTSSYTTDIFNFAKENSIELILPQENELKYIAIAINKLRKVYNLSLEEIRKGSLTVDLKPEREITEMDCFEIGKMLFKENDFSTALIWFKEALSNPNPNAIEKQHRLAMLTYLTHSYYYINDYENALKTVAEYLIIDPDNEAMKNHLLYFSTYLKIHNGDIKINTTNENIITDENLNHDKLCRNEQLKTARYLSKLKCYYNYKSPQLFLQPAKIEDVHLSPWIFLIHDAIKDEEINQLIDYGYPKLKRAQILGESRMGETSPIRTSKLIWIGEHTNKIVYNLKKRLEYISGLILIDHSESLQLNNYGFGGFYDPHTDYANPLPDTITNQYFGNRIATALFYMSDVVAGGRTVFPRLNISVSPEKGSAIFWYNLLKSGKGDIDTIHAGCPVLAGNKWVSNVWIREFTQMFISPCGLSSKERHKKPDV